MLLSTPERVRFLAYIISKDKAPGVTAIAKDLRLSKAFVSLQLSAIKKEGLIDNQNRLMLDSRVQALRILLFISDFDQSLLKSPCIISAGIYGSYAKGLNSEGSDLDVWIYHKVTSHAELAGINSIIKKKYPNAQVLFISDSKLEEIRKDTVFYHSLVFGSMVLKGEPLGL